VSDQLERDAHLEVLERLEEKLDVILGKLEGAEQAFAGFITGPGIGKMFKAIASGKG
jgi:hypothetical protein